MNAIFNGQSQICYDCVGDAGLQRKIESVGKVAPCSVCGLDTKNTISIRTLAGWIEEIWTEWYRVGPEAPVFYPDSDKVYYEGQGEFPSEIVSELIQVDSEQVVNAVVEIVGEDDGWIMKDGGDPVMEATTPYVQRGLHRFLIDERWREYCDGIHHRSRFFNQDALLFWEGLFGELEGFNGRSFPNLEGLKEATIQPSKVLKELNPGEVSIYRARKLERPEDYESFTKHPEKELSNPPDEKAREGRMNPSGISYFYGAFERETCVAELRPSISDEAISAKFSLNRPIKVLDFQVLERAYHEHPLSMFDEDFEAKATDRALIRELHSRISRPVLPGKESDYLATQVMAEYLSSARNPRLDGVIFSSVQHTAGRNIVLFPHVLGPENISGMEFIDAPGSAVKLISESLVMHRLTAVNYEHQDRAIKEGRLEFNIEDYEDDEDSLSY